MSSRAGRIRLGLAARLTFAATAAIALALAICAILISVVLARSLANGLRATALQSAREVAVLATEDRLPDPVPVAAGTATIQVVNAVGRITDASPDADLLVPLLNAPQRAEYGRMWTLDGGPFGLSGPVGVVAVPVGNGSTVIAAVSEGEVAASQSAVERILLIGTPLLLVVLAGASRLIIGSALRPITALRRGAQAISGTGRRLPVPAARDEVHRLAVTLNDMLARLQDADDRQRAFVSDAAHELRNPLAAIRAELEVQLQHPEAQGWEETAGEVLTDVLRLSKIADDLLALARLDESSPAVAQEDVDVAALARDVVARQGAALALEAGVTVVADAGLAPAVAVVRGVPGQLAGLVTNLVGNAAHYAAERVCVSVALDGTAVRVVVSDDGPGIPEADRERVFARFTRLDDARSREAGGAGLGLAIARESARAHGGDITLEDNAPGLRAVVRLPGGPVMR